MPSLFFLVHPVFLFPFHAAERDGPHVRDLDVFISYRRVNGSQLASLLKVSPPPQKKKKKHSLSVSLSSSLRLFYFLTSVSWSRSPQKVLNPKVRLTIAFLHDSPIAKVLCCTAWTVLIFCLSSHPCCQVHLALRGRKAISLTLRLP